MLPVPAASSGFPALTPTPCKMPYKTKKTKIENKIRLEVIN